MIKIWLLIHHSFCNSSEKGMCILGYGCRHQIPTVISFHSSLHDYEPQILLEDCDHKKVYLLQHFHIPLNAGHVLAQKTVERKVSNMTWYKTHLSHLEGSGQIHIGFIYPNCGDDGGSFRRILPHTYSSRK